jgi:hypothetical protein
MKTITLLILLIMSSWQVLAQHNHHQHTTPKKPKTAKPAAKKTLPPAKKAVPPAKKAPPAKMVTPAETSP